MDLKLIAKKNNWKLRKLDKVTFFQEGPGVRNHQYTTNGVKLLNVANLFEGQLDLSRSDRFISEDEAYGKYSHFLVDEGDLIIACSGIQVDYFHKKMGFAKKEHLPLCMNTSTMRFKTLDENILSLNYLAYYLKTDFFKKQIQRLITGSAQLNFGPSHIKKIDILIPPLETQKKIVEVLDKAQGLIDARKEQIRLMDELIQSVFYEMFGDIVSNSKDWTIDSLSNHLNVVGGYAFKSKEFAEEGIPVLKIGNINAGYFRPTNLAFWVKDVKLKRYEIVEGDLVMSLTGTVGKDDYGNVCVMGNDYPLYYLNQRNAKLDLLDTIDKHYIMNALKVPEIKKRLTGISRGVRQANISNRDILNLELPIPPIHVQIQYAEFVQHVAKLKVVVQKSLSETQELFDSLMQKYFE